MRPIDATEALAVLQQEHDNIMQDESVSKQMKWCESVVYHRTVSALNQLPSLPVIPYRGNKPLSLDDLRKMEDCPVWVEVLDHDVFANKDDDFNGWGMVRKSWVRLWDSKRADLVTVDYHFESYGKEWQAYSQPVRIGEWVFVRQRFVDGGYYDEYRCSECGESLWLPIGAAFPFYCNTCGSRVSGNKPAAQQTADQMLVAKMARIDWETIADALQYASESRRYQAEYTEDEEDKETIEACADEWEKKLEMVQKIMGNR